MARLLLVEDEDLLARSLAVGLSEELYVVERARDGEEALQFARSGGHDAIVLDLRLPKVDGLTVCRTLRGEGSTVPILVLTSADTNRDVVAGLDAGADDYLTKPFEFAVLLARLRALLRRGSAGASAVLSVADLELDLKALKARRGGRDIPLSATEFRLLEHLVRHAGEVQSKERVSRAMWHDGAVPDSNVLEVYVSKLRRKIDDGFAVRLIHTRRGSGYLLAAESR